MSKGLYVLMVLSLFGLCYTNAMAQEAGREHAMNEELVRLEGKDFNNPFGVLEFLHWNHPWNHHKYPDRKSLEKVVALMKEAGVGMVRMDFLWSDIEPRQGIFRFEKYDQIVDVLSQNNIAILGLLDYSADWASPTGIWNNPPLDNRLFVAYAAKVIERYREWVKYWEVWNEPDSRTYWATQDSLKSYCKLLRDVYTEAKLLDPGCKVLNGGLANGPLSVSRLYENRAKDYFDILNIHIFESPLHEGAQKRIESYVNLAHKVMERNGDGGKKIWVTEIGCPGVKPNLHIKNWWLGENPDEERQAEWVTTVYKTLLAQEPIEKVFWAFLRDCNQHWGNGVDYFGLVRWDFSKKPSFFTYQKCIRFKPSQEAF